MAKDLKNILLSEIEENKIKEKTPDKLPLNPTAEGWSGHEVRRFLAKSLIDSEGSFLSEFKKKMIEIKTQFENVFGDGDGDIQGQIDSIVQDIASIEGDNFDFIWIPNNGTPTQNVIDIIIIPDDSLGNLVTDEKTLANYFNKEDSQYPPKKWKYRIIKYKRGTMVLEILSTGVMKFSQEAIEYLINSRLEVIENIIEEKYKTWDKPTLPPPLFYNWIKPLDIDSLGEATTFSLKIETGEDETQQIEVENIYGADGIVEDETQQIEVFRAGGISQDDTPQLTKEEDQMEVILTNGRVEDETQQIEVENIYGADGISQDDTPQLPKEEE